MNRTPLYFIVSLVLISGAPAAAQASPKITDLSVTAAGMTAATVLDSIRAALSPDQKRRADMLISVFENSTTTLQYAYIEDLHDGRGYTAGRAGFCSGCGDMLTVVQRYTKLEKENPLAKYLPRLRELADSASDSTSGLDGFTAAWALAAQDPVFCKVQNEVSDSLYCLPALKYAASLGLKKDLSKVALYEAAIQHGLGGGPDSLEDMAQRASQSALKPADGGDEKAWLKQFLIVRRATLAHAADPSTQAAWADSVGRADAMRAIFDSGNMDFTGPITVNPYGDQFVIQ